jgi:hypothetical protein
MSILEQSTSCGSHHDDFGRFAYAAVNTSLSGWPPYGHAKIWVSNDKDVDRFVERHMRERLQMLRNIPFQGDFVGMSIARLAQLASA